MKTRVNPLTGEPAFLLLFGGDDFAEELCQSPYRGTGISTETPEETKAAPGPVSIPLPGNRHFYDLKTVSKYGPEMCQSPYRGTGISTITGKYE